jgi:hypothetical protein
MTCYFSTCSTYYCLTLQFQFQEAVRYVQRQEYETRLLDFIDSDFVFQGGSENKTSSNETEVKTISVTIL